MAKIQIRQGVFETNSSSVHTIAIKTGSATIPKDDDVIEFGLGDFGCEIREYKNISAKASYLFTGILSLDGPPNSWWGVDMDKCIQFIKGVLDKHDIPYQFAEVDMVSEMVVDQYTGKKERIVKYVPKDGFYSGIDHVEELRDFILKITSDEDMLLDYLFGHSEVVTGNDSQEDETNELNKIFNGDFDYIFEKGN